MSVQHIGSPSPASNTTTFSVSLPPDIRDGSWLTMLTSANGAGTIDLITSMPTPVFDSDTIIPSSGTLSRGWVIPVGAAYSGMTVEVGRSAASRLLIVGGVVEGDTPDAAMTYNFPAQQYHYVPSTSDQGITLTLGALRIASPSYEFLTVPPPLTNVHDIGTLASSGVGVVGFSAEGAGAGGQTVTQQVNGRQTLMSVSFAPRSEVSPFSLWDGVEEISLTVPTMWDGAVEVPLTLG